MSTYDQDLDRQMEEFFFGRCPRCNGAGLVDQGAAPEGHSMEFDCPECREFGPQLPSPLAQDDDFVDPFAD